MDVDMIPVVAMEMGLALLAPAAPDRILTPEESVLMALGGRDAYRELSRLKPEDKAHEKAKP